MAERIFTRRTTDPRFLLKKNLSLMAAVLKDLVEKRRLNREQQLRSAKMGVPVNDDHKGLTYRDVESLIAMARCLSNLASKADADDLARKRQLRNMTPEQLEALEAATKAAAHGDAIKEGLDDKQLEEDLEGE